MWSETPKFIYVHEHKHIHSPAHNHRCDEATVLSICGLWNWFVTIGETSFCFCFGLSRLLCAMITNSRCSRWLTITFFCQLRPSICVNDIEKKQCKKWEVTVCTVWPMVVPIGNVRLQRCKLKNFVFWIYSSLFNYVSIIIMHLKSTRYVNSLMLTFMFC